MGDTSLPRALQESLDDTKVSYVRLGASGLKVSIPILGTMSFGIREVYKKTVLDALPVLSHLHPSQGHKEWQPWVIDDIDEVDKLLKGAYDRGLNTWDTANVYSNGESERMIGQVIKKHNIPRHKLVLLSKCWGTVGEEAETFHIRYPDVIKKSKDYVNQDGLSRAGIFNAVEASLDRLGTTYLDVLQIHRFDKSVPVEETMKALHDLVQSGKVRYIGASSMWAYQFARMQECAAAHGWTKFISMQKHYSLCYREEEREMNPYCHETGVDVINWAPLYRGLLARPLDSEATVRQRAMQANPKFGGIDPNDRKIIERVMKLAERKGWKMSQVALAWNIQKNAIPIVGVSKLERLEEAIAVRGRVLSEEEMKYLEEPYKPKAIEGHS